MAEAARATLTVVGADAMLDLGRSLAAVLRAGDLVVLTGDLGAGKTTLARGIGAGLRVRDAVTSPTFVIARRHPALHDGPALLHVDAYRLGADELHDLELDVDLVDCVVLVEWGAGKVDHWVAPRLEIVIDRGGDEGGDGGGDGDGAAAGGGGGRREGRAVRILGSDPRWDEVDWSGLSAAAARTVDP